MKTKSNAGELLICARRTMYQEFAVHAVVQPNISNECCSQTTKGTILGPKLLFPYSPTTSATYALVIGAG